MQGPYITDPTQATCPRVCSMCGPYLATFEYAVCVAPIPQRELDHTDQGYTVSALKELAQGDGNR